MAWYLVKHRDFVFYLNTMYGFGVCVSKIPPKSKPKDATVSGNKHSREVQNSRSQGTKMLYV